MPCSGNGPRPLPSRTPWQERSQMRSAIGRAHASRRRHFSLRWLSGLSNRRQREGEFAPLTGIAAHRDRTAVACDDAVHDGKPKTGAVADTFGREKGFEDAFDGSLIHAAPRIRDGKKDRWPGLCMRRGLALGRAPQPDSNFTEIASNGVSCIGHEINDHLVEFASIAKQPRNLEDMI